MTAIWAALWLGFVAVWLTLAGCIVIGILRALAEIVRARL